MSDATALSTVRFAAAVQGPERDAADPAELLHEASKLYPTLLGRQLHGVAKLVQDPRLVASSARAVRRHPALPVVPLPRAELPPVALSTALRARRSARSFADEPVGLTQLAALLAAAYGVTRRADGKLPPLRTAPSAGALYPLELFLLVHRVEGLEAGVYHYDPLAHRLERHPSSPAAAEQGLFPSDEETATAALVIVLAAVFWRSRVKYGLRAYRFTLLEAGHVTQNLLLAATALKLDTVVLGGFYDARMDALLGLDGVDESSLIAVCAGRPE